MNENKVQFGLKNVHIAPITGRDPITQALIYEDVKPVLGAVNLNLEPKGEVSEFFADDMVYYATTPNQGYTGELEIARTPEWFEKEILGREVDEESGVIFERTDQKTTDFAMSFEFDGDVTATRYWFYNTAVSRPGMEGSTKTETVEPKTQTLALTFMPRPNDLLVKSNTSSKTPDNVYKDWYKQPFEITKGEGDTEG